MKVVAAAAAVAAVLCLVGDAAGEEKKQQSYSETPGGSDAALVRDPKIFAVRISTSVTVLATTTISALSTCLSLNNGAEYSQGGSGAVKWRVAASEGTGKVGWVVRVKVLAVWVMAVWVMRVEGLPTLVLKLDMDELFSSQDMTLSGSLNSDYEEEEEAEEEEEEDEGVIKSKVKEDRNGRKFTIWNSSLTTITVTSTSFFAGTTVTATAFCSAPGLTIGCFDTKELYDSFAFIRLLKHFRGVLHGLRRPSWFAWVPTDTKELYDSFAFIRLLKHFRAVVEMAPAATQTLLVMTVAVVTLWPLHATATNSTTTTTTTTAAATPSEDRVGEQRRAERLLAFYTTTSVKLLATTTISVPFTCLSTNPGSAPCNGRRKRALWNDMEILRDISGVELLEGSEGDEAAVKEGQGERERDGRKLTIWSTVKSTLTLTSTSYLVGTTITATAFCLTAGISQGCFG
ncbi:hypothetical protein O3P69_005770 [Scylla paramamosain]|uniref:Uncharacterized protein n=1 Tax=Scylla paramamosain TaxID=85552 RepID=A0AAW0U715_SCYPA